MNNYMIVINGRTVKEFQAKSDRSAKIQASKFYAREFTGYCYFMFLRECKKLNDISVGVRDVGSFSAISYSWVS